MDVKMMQALNLPMANLNLSKKDNAVFVWCIARKKQLLLTPEEWVRQHFIHHLVNNKNIPLGLLISEHSIVVNKLKRRCDLVVFGHNQQPKLIVECKSPDVIINEAVFNQIAQYNFELNVDYLVMTNGLQHIVCQIDRINSTINYLKEIPDFSELNT